MTRDQRFEGPFTIADLPELFAWLRNIQAGARVSLSSVIAAHQVHPAAARRGHASRSTINRLMLAKQPSPSAVTLSALGALREYLWSVPQYRQFLPGDEAPPLPPLPALSTDELLSLTLARFFEETGHGDSSAFDLGDLKSTLPGRYVMYRLDLEPAQRKKVPQQLVRASLIEFRLLGHALCVSETQDFPATPLREDPHRQTNTGIIGVYGNYLIGLLRTIGNLSFKCMVINELIPAFGNQRPLTELRGKMLVASRLGLFPSALFVCRRIKGDQYQHGIYVYSDIDPDVVRYLTAPTFPGYDVVV